MYPPGFLNERLMGPIRFEKVPTIPPRTWLRSPVNNR
eukprot:SAG22_NODE_18658_length_283_cov_0.875000_1_plen_36_part_10